MIWVDRLVGGAAVVLGTLATADGSRFGTVLALLGLLVATQLWGRINRLLFVYRGQPDALAVAHQTITSEGVHDVSGSSHQSTPWSTYAAMLHLPDMVVLLRRKSGNSPMLLLHRRGLRDPATWTDLVAFVEQQVPDHPHDPNPRGA